MRRLLIESATPKGLVALSEDENIVALREFPLGADMGVPLVPHIHALLQDLDWFPSALDLLVVGVGPGSYTGIRLAAAVAKGISYPHSLPLVGVSSLAGFVPEEREGAFVALLDAKMGGVYFWCGVKTKSGAVMEGEPRLASIEEIFPLVKKKGYCVTPNETSIAKRFAEQGRDITWEWESRNPDPRTILREGIIREKSGKVSRDGSLTLLYLRKTQAEIEKERE